MLRDWFNTGKNQDRPKDQERAPDLVKNVLETGLEPSRSPLLLPLIENDDIKLLCWMAIECENDDGALE